jgi:hypothetical protein
MAEGEVTLPSYVVLEEPPGGFACLRCGKVLTWNLEDRFGDTGWAECCGIDYYVAPSQWTVTIIPKEEQL